MKPEIRSTRNETLTHHKRNSVYITSQCEKNEVKFCFEGASKKTTHLLKAMH